MKVKTSELTGPALDWTAALAAGYDEGWLHRQLQRSNPATSAIPRLGSDWAEAGPIIERERISVISDFHEIKEGWLAESYQGNIQQFGPTPLIAAMRCYVASKLGEEVEIPEELTA